jgi:hypothetical protein
MDGENIRRVHLSGIIHDVGKIGIEDKILRKAAALTDDEYEMMKQHPTKGEHILDAGAAAQGARRRRASCTTRTWTAAATRAGLKGEEIPLLGRIVSVADAFDAMTTDRPYSKAMSFEAGIARLKFLSGKKFDPGCVDAVRAGVPDRGRDARQGAQGLGRPASLRHPRADGRRPAHVGSRGRARGARTIGVEGDHDPSCRRASPRRGAPAARPSRARAELGRRRDALLDGGHAPARGSHRPRARRVQEGRQGDAKNPYFQKGLGLAYSAKATRTTEPKSRDELWKSAIAAFRRSLELNPYYVDVRNDLAAALIGSGERDAAKKEFLTAYSDPTNPTPEVSARNLGQAFFDEKNYPEAINWFRTSLKRNKDYTDAYLGLADALAADRAARRGGRPARGGDQGDPERRGAAALAGTVAAARGPFAEARTGSRTVVRKDPGGPLGRAAADALKSVPK